MGLPWYETIPLFIAVLIPLVLIHEFGHFITAKLFRVAVPEFAIGFPPRILTFWHSPGWVEIQSRHLVVPNTFKLPDKLTVGSRVIYKTETIRGREVLTGLDLVDAESSSVALTSPVQNFDRGTEYTLNWLPLGGYVRMSGEEDPNAPNAFAAKAPWQRLIVLSAGVIMNFILALVIFVIIAANLPVPVVAATTEIAGISPDSPVAQAGLQAGDLIVSINGADVRNNLTGLRQTLSQNSDRQVTLVVERATATGARQIQVTVTPRSNPPPGQGALGVLLNQQVGAEITRVAPGSLAEKIGLRPDDGLVSIGNSFTMVNQQASLLSGGLRDESALADYIRSLHGVSYILPVTYIRGGLIQPMVNLKIPSDLPTEQADLGINLHLSAGEAVGTASSQMYDAVTSIPRTLGALFQQGPATSGFMGPVGIVRLTGEVAGRGGVWGIINLLGVLSLNLAVVNLFPIPGLDGGRLIFVLLELVRGGKKIDPQKEGIVHLIGMAFLLSLMLIFTFFDVSNWLSGKPLFGP